MKLILAVVLLSIFSWAQDASKLVCADHYPDGTVLRYKDCMMEEYFDHPAWLDSVPLCTVKIRPHCPLLPANPCPKDAVCSDPPPNNVDILPTCPAPYGCIHGMDVRFKDGKIDAVWHKGKWIRVKELSRKE